MRTYRVINGIIIEPDIEENAKEKANRSGEKVGIWESSIESNLIVLSKTEILNNPKRLEILGYQPKTGSSEEKIPQPLIWIEPTEKNQDKYERMKGKKQMNSYIDHPIMPAMNSLNFSLASTKVKMTKEEWFKIGNTQGWLKNKDQKNFEKEAWINLAIQGGLLAAQFALPWVINKFFGGDKEAAEQAAIEAQQSPEKAQQYAQITQQAESQVSQMVTRASELTNKIRTKANEVKAPCANRPMPSVCMKRVSSDQEFEQAYKRINDYFEGIKASNNPERICEALVIALDLEFCARSINNQFETARTNAMRTNMGTGLGTLDYGFSLA